MCVEVLGAQSKSQVPTQDPNKTIFWELANFQFSILGPGLCPCFSAIFRNWPAWIWINNTNYMSTACPQRCPNQGPVWYDSCTLRFLGHLAQK
jgi:hypothetical protein